MKRAMVLLVLAGCSEKPADKPAPKPEGGLLQYRVPEAWTSRPPANKLRKAQYSVPDKEKKAADAELVYSYFGPSGGGTLDENMERWAGQFGTTRESAKVEKATGSHPVTFVRLKGTYEGDKPGFVMMVAAVETEQGMHYLKLVGPDVTVSDWSAEFRKLALEAR